MLKKTINHKGIVFFLTVLVFCCCATGKVMEKKSTVSYGNTSIDIVTYGDVEVTKVEPEMKIKKGEEKGDLTVRVELKNTGTKADRYNVFASGVSKESVSEGGNAQIPEKGFLEPGQKTEGKIKTNFKGKSLPSTIIVEVYSLGDIGHEPDLLETLFSE
jgi:hypothetical protein